MNVGTCSTFLHKKYDSGKLCLLRELHGEELTRLDDAVGGNVATAVHCLQHRIKGLSVVPQLCLEHKVDALYKLTG